jgi:Protein of unknown function with HXXEE motif
MKKSTSFVCSTLCVPARFVSILVFSGPAFAWLWTVFKLGNGIGHTALASSQGGYLPGVATAPVLLALSTYLAVHHDNALVMASSRCGVGDVQRGSRE